MTVICWLGEAAGRFGVEFVRAEVSRRSSDSSILRCNLLRGGVYPRGLSAKSRDLLCGKVQEPCKEELLGNLTVSCCTDDEIVWLFLVTINGEFLS